jgi:CBS domain-containing protein
MAGEKLIKDYMQDVLILQENTAVREAMTEMLKQKQRLVAIVSANRRIQGVLTYGDIIRELHKDLKSSKILTATVETLMIDYTNFSFAEPNNTMLIALEQMAIKRLRNVVIIDRLVPVGVLKQENIIQWWLEVVAPNIKP